MATVLGLATSYLVAANLFLSTSLFDKAVNGDPDSVSIHYSRGWTLRPQRIHAKNLSIRGRDRNVEWILRADEIEFDVSFVGLLKKRFEVSRARGKGLS